MYSYRIIMLGPSGSGKTVYLGSIFQKLSSQGDWGFFLETDSQKQKRLNGIYTKVATGEKWPDPTKRAEVSEWDFTCSVHRNGTKYSACKFIYLDYAGGIITEEDSSEYEADFERQVKEADIMLGLLDGDQLCALMRGEGAGVIWLLKDFKNMLDKMMGNVEKPIHFIVSKWDVVESNGYSLKQVREKLLESSDQFGNLVRTRKENGSVTRLIPVSSVGQGFAKRGADGQMQKILGKIPKPFQVEVTLACVLPDLIQSKQKELAGRRREEERRSTTVTPDYTGGEEFSRNLPGWLKKVPGIKKMAGSAEEKRIEAEKRSEELRREKAAALNKIADERSALESVVNSFILIQNQLYRNFPNSDLS